MLSRPIHEHGMCFHLFVSSSISFFSVLNLSEFKSFTALVKFIPRDFNLFEAIVNGNVFLVFLSGSLILAYKNLTHFWILSCIHSAILLNSFIISSSFLVESSGFSILVR